MAASVENQKSGVKAAVLAAIAQFAPTPLNGASLPSLESETAVTASHIPIPEMVLGSNALQQDPKSKIGPKAPDEVLAERLMERRDMELAQRQYVLDSRDELGRLLQEQLPAKTLEAYQNQIQELTKQVGSFIDVSKLDNTSQLLINRATQVAFASNLRADSGVFRALARDIELDQQLKDIAEGRQISDRDKEHLLKNLKQFSGQVGGSIARRHFSERGITDIDKLAVITAGELRREIAKVVTPEAQQFIGGALQVLLKKSPTAFADCTTGMNGAPLFDGNQLLNDVGSQLFGRGSLIIEGKRGGFKALSDDQRKQYGEQVEGLRKEQEALLERLGQSIAAELKYSDAKSQFKKAQAEHLARGGDPRNLEKTPEFKALREAEELRKQTSFTLDEAVDGVARIAGQIDPRAGKLVNNAFATYKGLQSIVKGGLSNIKLTDLLSVTNLGLALIDSLISTPDPTQQYFEQMGKMLEQLDQKIDKLSGQVYELHKDMIQEFDQVHQRFDRLEEWMERLADGITQISIEQEKQFKTIMGNFDEVNWNIDRRGERIENILRDGFSTVIGLQLFAIQELGKISEKLDGVDHKTTIIIGFLEELWQAEKRTQKFIIMSPLQVPLAELKDDAGLFSNPTLDPLDTEAKRKERQENFVRVLGDFVSVASTLSKGDSASARNENGKQPAEVEYYIASRREIEQATQSFFRSLGLEENEMGNLHAYPFLLETVELLLDVQGKHGYPVLSYDELDLLRRTLQNAQASLALTAEKAVDKLLERLGNDISPLRNKLQNKQLGVTTIPVGGQPYTYDYDNAEPSLQTIADQCPLELAPTSPEASGPRPVVSANVPEIVRGAQQLSPRFSNTSTEVHDVKWIQQGFQDPFVAQYATMATVDQWKEPLETWSRMRGYRFWVDTLRTFELSDSKQNLALKKIHGVLAHKTNYSHSAHWAGVHCQAMERGEPPYGPVIQRKKESHEALSKFLISESWTDIKEGKYYFVERGSNQVQQFDARASIANYDAMVNSIEANINQLKHLTAGPDDCAINPEGASPYDVRMSDAEYAKFASGRRRVLLIDTKNPLLKANSREHSATVEAFKKANPLSGFEEVQSARLSIDRGIIQLKEAIFRSFRGANPGSFHSKPLTETSSTVSAGSRALSWTPEVPFTLPLRNMGRQISLGNVAGASIIRRMAIDPMLGAGTVVDFESATVSVEKHPQSLAEDTATSRAMLSRTSFSHPDGTARSAPTAKNPLKVGDIVNLTISQTQRVKLSTPTLTFQLHNSGGRIATIVATFGGESGFEAEIDSTQSFAFRSKVELPVSGSTSALPASIGGLHELSSRSEAASAFRYSRGSQQYTAYVLDDFFSATDLCAKTLAIRAFEEVRKARGAAWIDGLQQATYSLSASDGANQAGLFSSGDKKMARAIFQHRDGSKFVAEFEVSNQLQSPPNPPTITVMYAGDVNLAEARAESKSQSETASVISAFRKAEEAFHQKMRRELAEKKYKDLEKGGTQAQQAKVLLQASALQALKLLEAFGDDLVQRDLEAKVRLNGPEGIKDSLYMQMNNPREGLLDVAAKLAAAQAFRGTAEFEQKLNAIGLQLTDEYEALKSHLTELKGRGIRYQSRDLNRALERIKKAQAEALLNRVEISKEKEN